MVSRLVHTNPAFRERARAKAEAFSTLGSISGTGPWMGYVPDLIVNPLDANYFASCKSVFPRSLTTKGSVGEVLMLEPGWTRLSDDDPSTSLPLGTGSGQRSVLWIGRFASTNSSVNYETLAWTAGDGSTENTAGLYGVNETSKDWERITHVNTSAGNPEANAIRPKGDRDAMPDVCVFAAGAPGRTDFSGAIAEPVLIITNNVDPVYVYPDSTSGTNFEDLTDTLDPFLAKSCEVFNNRVYYLNTSEAGTRYPQRLRRSPPFTCDPDTSAIGSGASDLKDFSGDGLRAERLGSVLACYFEDGVAFVRATGNYTAPDAFQTVSTSRGLISTHSLVNIGNDTHFGIFSDGWYELDPSGRFREVGLVDTGGGVVSGKWKSTFYSILSKDPAKRSRLFCHYESATDKIYISVPTDDDSENAHVWVYDRHADRVFLDEYEAICFGEVERQTKTAETYTTIAPETYSSIAPETYATVAAEYGLKALVHGESAGYVFQHDPDVVTRDLSATTGNASPSYSISTHPFNFGHPNHIAVADRVVVEYVGFDSGAMLAWVSVPGATNDFATVDISTAGDGEMTTAVGYFRKSGKSLQYTFTGSGPLMLKTFVLDVFDEKVDDYG